MVPLIKVFYPPQNPDLLKRIEFSRTKEHLAFFYQELPEFEYLVYSDPDVPFDFHYTDDEDEIRETNVVCVFYEYNTEDILDTLTSYLPGGGITIKNAGYLNIKCPETLPLGDHHYILYCYEDDPDVVKVLDRNSISVTGKVI